MKKFDHLFFEKIMEKGMGVLHADSGSRLGDLQLTCTVPSMWPIGVMLHIGRLMIQEGYRYIGLVIHVSIINEIRVLYK